VLCCLLVIAVEVGGSLALIAGFKTRWAALLLAGFSLASAALFHNNFADQMQMINFMKTLRWPAASSCCSPTAPAH